MSDFVSRRVMMVDTQVRPSDVTKFPIIAAMLHVPREEFVPESQREAAYVGLNIDFAQGRVVLEPRTLAKMLDAVDVAPGEKVLVIGAAYGYGAALLVEMGALVVAVENDLAAAEVAQELVPGAKILSGGMEKGAASDGPYDVILIEGGVEAVPSAVLDQIKDGGRIAAIFMEGALGTVRIGVKANGGVSWRFAFNAAAPVLPGFAAQREFAL